MIFHCCFLRVVLYIFNLLIGIYCWNILSHSLLAINEVLGCSSTFNRNSINLWLFLRNIHPSNNSMLIPIISTFAINLAYSMVTNTLLWCFIYYTSYSNFQHVCFFLFPIGILQIVLITKNCLVLALLSYGKLS